MLSDFTGADHVYIACGYTDLRHGIDGLAELVRQQFRLDPFSNTLFLFCGRKQDRIKALYWEGNGFLLLYKRLERGVYQWPRSESEARELTPQWKQFAILCTDFDGVPAFEAWGTVFLRRCGRTSGSCHRLSTGKMTSGNLLQRPKSMALSALFWYHCSMESKVKTTSTADEMITISRAEYEALKEHNAELQVLREAGKKAQTKSYMWLYRTSGDAEHPIVLYDYKPNRKIENAEEFLGDFHGYLHADGYPGYHKLPERITVVGCLAHARRKFADALKVLPMEQRRDSGAAEALQYFAKIAAWEKKLESVTPEKRYKMRQEKEKPILDALYAWAEARKNVAPKSALGKALYYLREQRPYLERYLLHIFRTAPNLDQTSADWILPLLPENAPDDCKVNT